MSADPNQLGVFERVLLLKAVPELSDVHPDDLANVAERTTPHRLPAGGPLPADGDGGCLHFLVEGSVREDAGEGEPVQREAPALLGALQVLAGSAGGAGAAERESTALSIGRSALVEVLRDDFEVWFALLCHVCRLALAEPGGAILAAVPSPGGVGDATPSAPLDLAERVAVLRRAPALGGLRVHVLGQIAAEMEEVAFGPDEAPCEPGVAADWLQVIVAGCATHGPGGRSQLGPGSLLGFAEAFAGEPWRHAVAAPERLRALRLAPETLIDILEDHPDEAVDLLCALAREVLRLPRVGAVA